MDIYCVTKTDYTSSKLPGKSHFGHWSTIMHTLHRTQTAH